MSYSDTTSEPRWRRRPEERPRQLIEAALEVFGEHGLAGARLEDIAKRAGVSKGTIYLYFPNKEALFREMVRQKVIEEIEAAEQRLATGTPTEQLQRFMHGYWTFLRSPAFGTIYRLVHGELHHFPDLAQFYSREVIQRGIKLVAEIVRRGAATGEFRTVDPTVAARMLGSIMVSHAVWCSRRTFFTHVADETDEQCIDAIIDFYLHALRADPSVFDAGTSRT
ncbi:MAG TPA: TetR/AcrR family transcriptional regulator [Gemmatimonadaceae bacterium]|nr:TetR/AcrR family transcriptional regulator [Gemmatimonadaceae bacterium]